MIVSAALISPSCAPNAPSEELQPRYGGTLVVSELFNPVTWVQVFEPAGAWWASFVLYDRLVDYDLDLNIYPGLAYKWEISPDGLTYTFHLYQNVTWHDGVKFTSADVKFTFDEVIAKQGFGAAFVSSVDSISCPDDYTVLFKLKAPDAPFLYKLGTWTGGTHIIAKHIFEGTDWKTNPATTDQPIGTGAFKFKEFVSGDHYTLVANDNYFKGRPYIDQVVYRIIPERAVSQAALETGELQHMVDPPAFSELGRLEKDPNLDIVVRMAGDDSMVLEFNLNREPFNDIKVRQAIAYAIDREEVAQKATFGYDKPGIGAYANWTGVDWAFNQDAKLPEYNPAKAEQLLDEAGYRRGADGVRFSTTLNTLTIFYEMEPTIMLIKEQLKKVGIDVKAEVMEYAAYWDKVYNQKDFDMTVTVVYFVPDPWTIGDIVGTGSFDNIMNYSNPRVDELLAQALVPVDREQRKKYYFEIQEILVKELPYIHLIHYAWPMAKNSKWHGFYFEEGTLGTRFDWRKVWWEGGTLPTVTTTSAKTTSAVSTPTTAVTTTSAVSSTTVTEGGQFPWTWLAAVVIVVVVAVVGTVLWMRRRRP